MDNLLPASEKLEYVERKEIAGASPNSADKSFASAQFDSIPKDIE